MSVEENNKSDPLLRLPSSPVMMTMMRTIEGKPEGIPLWSSFISKDDEISMENENLTATLLSLARNITNLAESDNKEGYIFRVTIEKKSYNFFIPHPLSDFQLSFIAVFETTDKILIKAVDKEELVKIIVSNLKLNQMVYDFINNGNDHVEHTSDLDKIIRNVVGQSILVWDKKRVKYLEKKLKEERKRLVALAKKQEENISN